MKQFVSVLVATSLVLALLSLPALGCTTIMVGKDLTADGSVMLAHNEDMGFESIGRLWSVPAATHGEDATVSVPYETLPRPEKTYQYWASGNTLGAKGLGITEGKKEYNSVLVGMNEHGVTMGCNWAYSKEENMKEKGVRRYAIRELLLARCKTAREAVEFIGSMIDTYGQADWGGLAYCIADPDEAWVVETTTQHWVAKRVPDDEIHVVANRYTIEEDYDKGSDDLVSFAKAEGWYDAADGPFNFKEAYGKPGMLDTAYDKEREARVHNLLDGKKGAISPEDLFMVLRDRYEGTDKYAGPQDKEVWRDYCNDADISRTICTNICQSSSVAQLRSDMPKEIGSILWYAMATPNFSGYFPLYAGASEVPEEYSNPSSEKAPDSAFWTFRNIQLYGDKDYGTLSTMALNTWNSNQAMVQQRMEGFEDEVEDTLDDTPKAAMEMINGFTYRNAANVLQKARVLEKAFD